jgi:hypothetical protein
MIIIAVLPTTTELIPPPNPNPITMINDRKATKLAQEHMEEMWSLYVKDLPKQDSTCREQQVKWHVD